MIENYFNTLIFCIVVSIGLLVTATVMGMSPWLSMIGALTPLGYYHLFYLAPKAKKELSQSAVDSVYYFGFLLTVAALGISAVSIAHAGTSPDLSKVSFQFGIGLIATGYAVIARMHLSSITSSLARESPEAILDRYIKRSLALVDNVEIAVVRTSEFSNIVVSKTNEVLETSQASIEKSLLDVAKVFEAEIKSTFATAKDNLSEIRGVMSDVSFAAERKELTKSIRENADATTQLSKALEELTHKSKEASLSTQQNISTSGNLDNTLVQLINHIGGLAGNDGPLVNSVQSIRAADGAVKQGTVSLSNAVDKLAEMS